MARSLFGTVGPRKNGQGAGISRLRQFAQNNLGVIMTNDMGTTRVFRKDILDTYDQYFEGCQYDGKQDWDAACKSEQYVPVRDRKPRINYNLTKLLANKITAKLCGVQTFPKVIVEDDPDDTEFFRTVIKAADLRRNLLEPIRRSIVAGSSFVRFFLVNGQIEMEYALSKFCYPQFDALGELESIEIKYLFEDWDDLKSNGDPKVKWYRMTMDKNSDVLFDEPDYISGSKPTFTEVSRNDHKLGWVQGEWLPTAKNKFDADGPSIIADIMGFIDEMNYSMSQSSQAVQYNQDPQLAIAGIDEEEVDGLIRSSQKAWNLGKNGEAKFIEAALDGVKQAGETRNENRNRILEVVRVAIMDPETLAGAAKSGRAMEILMEPLCELLDELRTIYEPRIRNLILKIALTCLVYNARGEQTMIETPPGYTPSSADLTFQWPSIFPPTLDDIKNMVGAAQQAAMAQLISKDTLTRWLAPVFNIENVDEELEKIAAQPRRQVHLDHLVAANKEELCIIEMAARRKTETGLFN